MLQKISIRNYALIDSLDIEFDQGLNIITGETGAGKSIILGALSLILGQRAESKYFFNQSKKCVIEGTFLLPNENLKSLFEENDLDFLKESILRREIVSDGKTRSFVNDTPVNLAILKQIGEKLIDIHSQQATQEINNPDFQLSIVDSLANHGQLLKDYRHTYKQYKQNQNLLKELINHANEARKKQDFESFLLKELEQADLKAVEQEELEQALQRLENSESIKKSLLATSAIFTEDEVSINTLLKEAITQLNQIEKYDPSIQLLNQRLRSATIEFKDIAAEVSALESNTQHHAEKLDFIHQRLDLIYSLQQKHRVSNNGQLLALQKELEVSLLELSSSDEKIEQLNKTIILQQHELTEQANSISDNRKKAIKLTESAVVKTLEKVGMPNAKILFSHQITDELTKDGLDKISLQFSANNGQALAPVGKVASGGELSRLMLAVKSLLAKHTSLPTLIFDEIDTGISGETALKVGDVVAELGKNMQVLAITHLPQIAAKGNAHYFVFKNEENNKTSTSIRKLLKEERINAIAEMLSGKNPGISAIENAKELLH
jgi:DNA repair protein RecN (Recombination protein N)